MARPAAVLQAKHWKALQLIEEGDLSIKEIAAACGISSEILYDLHEGNSKDQGTLALLFESEMGKINKRISKKIRHLVKDNKQLALRKVNEYLRDLQKTKADASMMKEVTKIINSLSKSTPTVDMEVSIHRGLTSEELTNEFKRLGALARFALSGRGVSSIGQERARKLPAPSGPGDPVPEE